MGIEFEFLKAGKGDCILISTEKGTDEEKNILIDGGISKTYNNTMNKTGTLKSKLREKVMLNLDLVVLTHIDDDHICGLIQLLKDKEHVGKVRELWFNSSDYIKVDISSDEKGYGPSNYFKELVSNHSHIDYRSDIFMENKKVYDLSKEIEIILLSPYKKQLDKLNIAQKKWDKEQIDKGKDIFQPCRDAGSAEKSSSSQEYNVRETEKNASSIAFILRYKDKKNFLFLGDADINVVNYSLKKLDKKFLNFEFVKLSHHGSFDNNINKDFLNIIEADKYVILTDGSYKHPSKKTIDLILEHRNQDKQIEFVFNYEDFYWERFSSYDEEEDNFEAYCERIIKCQ